jgi:hypothetical protein
MQNAARQEVAMLKAKSRRLSVARRFFVTLFGSVAINNGTWLILKPQTAASRNQTDCIR